MFLRAAALLCLSSCALYSQAPKPDPEECAVWQRELAFAQSFEKHDAKAFATYLHPDAVFNAGTAAPIRGHDAVLTAWASLIQGTALRLRWRPDVVNLGAGGNIAISRGPYTIEDLSPNTKVKYRIGTFVTIWMKQLTGEWLVVFDGGGPPASPAPDLEAAERHLSQVSTTCSAP